MSHGPAQAPARLYQSPTPAPDARVLVLFCHPARQRSRREPRARARLDDLARVLAADQRERPSPEDQGWERHTPPPAAPSADADDAPRA